jgi:hypothetical protein
MVLGKLVIMAISVIVKDSNDVSKEILSGISDNIGILQRIKCLKLMKAGLGNTLCKMMEGSCSQFGGFSSQIRSAKFSGRSTRHSIKGNKKVLRFLICNIDDGSSFPPQFDKPKTKY